MVFKPIFKGLFKPIFKNIFSPESTFPPNSNDLISWTFTKTSDSLFSKDVVIQSEENAKFVSSYALTKATATDYILIDNPSDFNMEHNKLHILDFNINVAYINLAGDYSNIIGNRPWAALKDAGFAIAVQNVPPYKMSVHFADGVAGFDVGGCQTTTVGLLENVWEKWRVEIDGTIQKIRFYKNDVLLDTITPPEWPTTTVIGNTGFYSGKVRIGKDKEVPVRYLNGYFYNFKATLNGIVKLNIPCQGSILDISGRNNHGTAYNNAGALLSPTFAKNNDSFHLNLTKGFDKYTLDSDPTNAAKEIYVPYVSGVPVVTSVSGYTKASSHPAGKWHNGAETKIVIGTTGVKDATGWIAKTTFKDKAGNDYTPAEADANEIFVRHTTAPVGYCKEVDMNTLLAVSSGEYVFVDNSNPVKIKNLLWYGIAPTNINSVKVHKFVNKTDFVLDENGAYIFDDNNFVVTED